MLKAFVCTESTQGEVPGDFGLIIGRRAWNDSRGGALDNLVCRGVVSLDADRRV